MIASVKKRFFSSALCFFVLCISGPLLAQRILTLEEALAMVQSGDVLSAERIYASEAADEAVRLQKADYWPTLQFRANVSHANEAPRIPVEFEDDTVLARQGTKNTFTSRFELTQMVYDFGRTKHVVDAAEFQAAAVKAAFDYQGAVIRNQVREQFYLALYYQKLDSIYADALPLYEEIEQISKVRRANGVALQAEVLKARVDLQAFITKQFTAQGEYRKALTQLAFLTGQPAVDFETQGAWPYLPDLEEWSVLYHELYRLALDHRADIDRLGYQSQEQAALSNSANALKYPTLMLQSDFSYFGPEAFGYYSGLSSRGLDAVNWRVGVGFTYNIFDGFRRRSQRSIANALHKQYRQQEADLENQIAVEIKLLLSDIQSLTVRAENSQLLIGQLNSDISAAATAFANGDISRMEYVQTRLPKTAAEVSMLENRSDIVQTLVRLEAAVGTDISLVLKRQINKRK